MKRQEQRQEPTGGPQPVWTGSVGGLLNCSHVGVSLLLPTLCGPTL